MAFKGTVSVRMGRNWIETTEQVRPVTSQDRVKLGYANLALHQFNAVREVSSTEKDILTPCNTNPESLK